MFQQSVVKTKRMFNEMFHRMRKIKENEMNVLLRKNDRLRTIYQDVNLLRELNGRETMEFNSLPRFEYGADEMPWPTIEIDKIASQLTDDLSERNESSLLSEQEQSFHNRALNEMMNGVLEIHWEDELKKEVPKPSCLIKLESDALSESEKELIYKYQQKLEKVQFDRDELIEKLLNEKNDLEMSRDTQVQKLNKCLDNLIKSKVYAHFAICSGELKILMCLSDRKQFNNLCERERQLM